MGSRKRLLLIGIDYITTIVINLYNKKKTILMKIFKLILLIFTSTISVGQSNFYDRLADSALTLIKQNVRYDPAYFQIKYPNGDVPAGKGVCTDVIIRTYRKLGVDLQKLVHEDMKLNFYKYPKIWGLKKTDKNIDHRRVPNLMTFFNKYGITKSVANNASDFLPGDIVCWNLGGSVTHIGIVVKNKSADKKRHLIVHNIGAGQVMEDCLFKFKIIGHYRYK